VNADPFWRALSPVLKEEGGLSLDRHDKGNWTGGRVGVGALKGTKYGIAASSYPDLDIRHLTVEQAGAIYRKDYWMAADCGALPAGVDLVIFDTAVNSGVGRARKFRDATAAIVSPVARIKAVSERRRAFYQGLDAFARYGRAWLGRVARIEALAVRMALEPVHESVVADAKLHSS